MNTTESNIRLAAIKLISRNGFESMSLRKLAAESGVNASTLYLYFQGKSELLLQLILEYFQGMSQEWSQWRLAAARADTKLRTFIACHVRYQLEHQDQAMLGNLEFRSLDEAALTLVRQARREYLKSLQELLEQGVREGSLSCAEPKLMARTLFNMLTHTCVWFQADGHWSIDDVVRHFSELVLKMLGALPIDASLENVRRPPLRRRATAMEVQL